MLAELFRGRDVDLPAMAARMKGLMDAEGLPYGSRDRTYNSRLAQELGKWAEREGKPAIHDALYRAYFVDGANVSDPDVLAGVAESMGLSRAEARRALDERTMRAAVDADWARARALGVTGVPTFVMGRQGVVGAQLYEALERLALAAGAVRRPS